MFNKKYLMILVAAICTRMHASGLSLASLPDGVSERIGAFVTNWKGLKRDYAFKTIPVEDLPSLLAIVQEIDGEHMHHQTHPLYEDRLSKLPGLQSLIQNIFDLQVSQLSEKQRPYPANLSHDQKVKEYFKEMGQKDLCFSGIEITTPDKLNNIMIQPILIDSESDKVVFKLCTPAYPNGYCQNPNHMLAQWRKKLDFSPGFERGVYGILTLNLEEGTAYYRSKPTTEHSYTRPRIEH